MIHDIKISFQLLKFGFQAKMQIVLMVIFLAVGILMDVISNGTYWLGSWFILLAPMYFSQLLYGLVMSNLVMVSPYNKRLQTTLPVAGNAILSFFCMTIMLAIKAWKIQAHSELTDAILFTTIMAGFASLIFNAYTAVVYKYYAVSMVLMMVTAGTISGWSGFHVGSGQLLTASFLKGVPFGIVAICAYGMSVLGLLIQYGISCLLYRRPLSEYAQGAVMKKYLRS